MLAAWQRKVVDGAGAAASRALQPRTLPLHLSSLVRYTTALLCSVSKYGYRSRTVFYNGMFEKH